MRICRAPQQWCEYSNRQLPSQVVVLNWHLTVPEVRLISLKPQKLHVPPTDQSTTLLSMDEVGGGNPREMVDFGGAFAAEMQGWVPERWVYDVLRGAAQPVRTMGRGVAHWLGGWRL